jgi:hypothetical protein
MNTLSRLLVVATAVSSLLFAFSQRDIERHISGSFLSHPMLQPSEKIDEMVITTGVQKALPLTAFCSPTKLSDGSIRVDCAELAVCANLAIGETFGVMDLIPSSIDWGELTWELSVDGHPIDLAAFGVSDFVYPDLAPHPSRIREVFRVARLWDVVLVNPTPGMHQLQGRAQPQDGAAAYTWVVDFTVATP